MYTDMSVFSSAAQRERAQESGRQRETERGKEKEREAVEVFSEG